MLRCCMLRSHELSHSYTASPLLSLINLKFDATCNNVTQWLGSNSVRELEGVSSLSARLRQVQGTTECAMSVLLAGATQRSFNVATRHQGVSLTHHSFGGSNSMHREALLKKSLAVQSQVLLQPLKNCIQDVSQVITTRLLTGLSTCHSSWCPIWACCASCSSTKAMRPS